MKNQLAVPVLFLATHAAMASPILEDWKRSLVLDYENGDSLKVSCAPREKDCVVHIAVGSRSFTFNSGDLDGLTVTADRADLYSVQGGDRSSNFSFRVSVHCPNDDDGYCMAEASVVDGELGPISVNLMPAESAQLHSLAPNKPSRPTPLRGAA